MWYSHDGYKKAKKILLDKSQKNDTIISEAMNFVITYMGLWKPDDVIHTIVASQVTHIPLSQRGKRISEINKAVDIGDCLQKSIRMQNKVG